MKLGIELLAISIGGAGGALLRYAITILSHSWINSSFPWGTLLANLIGCLLAGILMGSGHGQQHEIVRLGLGVGFLGSLTTFSTFSAETVRNALDGNWGIASANVVVNLAVCLIAVAIGVAIAKKLWP